MHLSTVSSPLDIETTQYFLVHIANSAHFFVGVKYFVTEIKTTLPDSLYQFPMAGQPRREAMNKNIISLLMRSFQITNSAAF